MSPFASCRAGSNSSPETGRWRGGITLPWRSPDGLEKLRRPREGVLERLTLAHPCHVLVPCSTSKIEGCLT